MAGRWLLISLYFPPDQGAAANRMHRMAQQLKAQGCEVTVWCPMPHYPQAEVPAAYRKRWHVHEQIDGVQIHRFYISPSPSKNIWKRLWSALSFVAALTPALIFKKCPEKVLIQCPPLPLAAWALWILQLRGKYVTLNVSDLWPHTGISLGLLKPQAWSTRIMAAMAQRCYRQADVVLGQSLEIMATVQQLAPHTPVQLYRNFPHPLPAQPAAGPEAGPFTVSYAGLLGLAQELLYWVQAPLWQQGVCELHLWGDGPQRAAIEAWVQAHPNCGVYVHGWVERQALADAVGRCHVALVPLAQPLLGAVPSKIFEMAQHGIPCIYAGSGEAADLVQSHQLGWVIAPQDVPGLQQLLQVLQQRPIAEWQTQRLEIWEEAQRAFSMEKQWGEMVGKGVL